MIIGGLLTYLGQSFLKNREIKITNENNKREAVNKIFTNLTGLNFCLRELAYLEVDSKFQFQISCKETGDNKKRALEEHYNDYKYIAENRSKISIALSEIQTGFMSYYKISKLSIPESHSLILLELNNHILNLKRHTEYPESLDLTTEMVEIDILTLKKEYTKNITSIENIVKKF